MEYTMEDRGQKIIEFCMKEKSVNPVQIFEEAARQDFIRIHGPEHHILDGASILTAYYNAGGDIPLEISLQELMRRGLQMPGAACGLWGVCGAVSSMGAALSIIDGTGPVTTDGTWGKHMHFTSSALQKLAEVGGPRCCKRDAFLSFEEAVTFINQNYDVNMEISNIVCTFHERNQQCIGNRCPFRGEQ